MIVDVILNESLNSIIGPVQTLKRLKNSEEFLHNKGFDLSFYTSDIIKGYSGGKLNNTHSSNNSINKRIKSFARYLALHSFIYSIIRIQLLFKSSKPLIDYYDSLKRNPDIVVFHSIFDCYQYIKKHYETSVKIVLFVHGESTRFNMLFKYFPKASNSIIERKLDSIGRRVMERVDRVVSISRIAADNFIKEHPCLSEKISIVVNGINDLSEEQKKLAAEIRLNYKEPNYRLVCCGSINGRKGHKIILEALAQLPDKLLNQYRVLFVGDGPERINLESWVKANNMASVVVFVGAIPNDEVYKYLAQSNIYILMSKNEGLPISLIEAIRSGLPCIASNVSGIPEIVISDYNGILINPDIQELGEVLNNIANYDWGKYGINSRQLFMDSFTFNRMRDDYVKMLLSVVS